MRRFNSKVFFRSYQIYNSIVKHRKIVSFLNKKIIFYMLEYCDYTIVVPLLKEVSYSRRKIVKGIYHSF